MSLAIRSLTLAVLSSLSAVTVRVRLHPVPRRLDYRAEVLEAGRPAEFASNLVGACDEHGGVAGASRADADVYVAAGHFARGVYDLFDGVAFAAAAEVVDGASLAEDGERGDVRAREGYDVYVVAHAGAVARRVVFAVDFDVRASSRGGLQDDGDEVSLRRVDFAAALGRARGVEVSE